MQNGEWVQYWMTGPGGALFPAAALVIDASGGKGLMLEVHYPGEAPITVGDVQEGPGVGQWSRIPAAASGPAVLRRSA